MNKNCNILISSAGRRYSLVKFFKESLKALNLKGKVYISDLNPYLAPANYTSDGVINLPSNSDPDFISSLLAQCLEFNIQIVIPTIDTELEILALNRELLKLHGIEIIVSSYECIHSLRDKNFTNNVFNKLGIPIIPSQLPPEFKFPVFYKPYNGSLSKGIGVIHHQNQLSPALINDESLIWLDYLSPKKYDEYTIDCYYNRNGKLITLVPRRRIEIRGGEVSKAVTEKGLIFNKLYQCMAKLEGARGCITLQVFMSKDSENIFGIEINPRFGGGYPLSYHAGANYPKNIIEEYFLYNDLDSSNNWKDETYMIRYDQEIIF
jgi:carbamoyl-phosphate synthase large subunit